MSDEKTPTKKPRRKNGKQFKGWDPDKERATYDADFYAKHERYYVRSLPFMAAFVKDSFPDVETIVDVGCGNGDMLDPLRADYDTLGVEFSEGGVEALKARGIDHLDHDLTTPMPELPAERDLVMSLEVWEHIPEQFEDQYVANLLAFNPKHLIVSCAEPGQWGRHHYNCSGVEQVREKMAGLGYTVDEDLTAKWRKIKYLATFYRKNTLVLHRDDCVPEVAEDV
jgi:SAM-dependent methyltransferase